MAIRRALFQCVARYFCPAFLSNLGEEAVAAPYDCLDELRRRGVVAEYLAELADVTSEKLIIDDYVSPYVFEQLLFGDQALGMLNEV
jgi:hypothetical protein